MVLCFANAEQDAARKEELSSGEGGRAGRGIFMAGGSAGPADRGGYAGTVVTHDAGELGSWGRWGDVAGRDWLESWRGQRWMAERTRGALPSATVAGCASGPSGSASWVCG
jgi:hypothetical protein